MSKFLGVAYWTVRSEKTDWLGRAAALLTILEGKKLAAIEFDCLPAGDQLTIRFGTDQFQMLVTKGQGHGVVAKSPSAGCFVLCLLFLKKAIGDLSIADDSSELVATRPKPSDPLYAADWLRCLPVAQELGLVTGKAFLARHNAVLSHVF